MINDQLINPRSIVVIGGSDDIQKPGGKVLKNLIDGDFDGELFVVNPKLEKVQGINSYKDVSILPNVDLAILAIAAKFCPQTIDILTKEKTQRLLLFYQLALVRKTKRALHMRSKLLKVLMQLTDL